jgi:hypothetical protein
VTKQDQEKLHQKEVVVADPGKAVALSVQWDVRVTDKRQASFTTYVERDGDEKQINEVLNKMINATNRIERIFELEALETRLEVLQKQLAQLHTDYDANYTRYKDEWSKSGRRGPIRMEARQTKYLDDNRGMQDRHHMEINALEAQIDIVRRKLGYAADSSADRRPVL